MLRASILRLAAPVARQSAPRAVAAIPRCTTTPFLVRAAAAPRIACQMQMQLSQRRNYSAGGPLAKSEVEGRIVNILSGFDKVTDPTKIIPTAHFANDLGLDSLDTVEVVMAIEEEFSIEIPDKDADSIHSIPQAVEYILKQSDAH